MLNNQRGNITPVIYFPPNQLVLIASKKLPAVFAIGDLSLFLRPETGETEDMELGLPTVKTFEPTVTRLIRVFFCFRGIGINGSFSGL